MDEHQRCSQFFEPTFDLAMHDLFVTWAAGACLYCMPKKELLLPVEFVNRHALTVWFSVPSMLATLQRYRLLTPESLPIHHQEHRKTREYRTVDASAEAGMHFLRYLRRAPVGEHRLSR